MSLQNSPLKDQREILSDILKEKIQDLNRLAVIVWDGGEKKAFEFNKPKEFFWCEDPVIYFGRE